MRTQSNKEPELISEAEAARILNATRGKLRQWRFRKQGPGYYKLCGTSIQYDKQEVLAWLAEQKREVSK